MPGWVKAILVEWLRAANLNAGRLFRRANKNGKAWGECLTEKAVRHGVREHREARASPSPKLCRTRHNRRTCARLCHAAGGEL